MDVVDFVRLLGTYYRDSGETIAKMHGKDARAMVVDIIREIEDILNQEEPLQELWENFKQSPDDYQFELTELLDTLQDLHSGFQERLDDFFAAYGFGVENKLPVVRSDMVDETDSDLYVRDLDTGLYSGTETPDTDREPPESGSSEFPDEEQIE